MKKVKLFLIILLSIFFLFCLKKVLIVGIPSLIMIFNLLNPSPEVTHISKIENFAIEPFYVINKPNKCDTSNYGNIFYDDYYIVTGYKKSKNQINTLDSFACELLKGVDYKFVERNIHFYSKSNITNNAYILENPRELVRYSYENDFEFKYSKSNGANFIYRNKRDVTKDDITSCIKLYCK